MVVITEEEYAQLQEDSKLLNALFGAGVDSWDGYEQALDAL